MKDNKIIHIVYISLIIIVSVASVFIFKFIEDNKEKKSYEQGDSYSEMQNNLKQYFEAQMRTEKELLVLTHKDKIQNIMKYYDNRLKYGEKLKTNVSLDNDDYFDSLKLNVGDIYNNSNGNNKITAFCTVLSGEEPEVGDVFLIEGFDQDRLNESDKTSQYSYEVILLSIDENQNSDGSKFLELSFEGVDTQDIKTSPKIRRLK